MPEESWDEFIRKAKEEYFKIGSIPCPVFGNEKVKFDKRGFRHLLYRQNKPRPRADQARRIHLLKYAKEIVVKSTTYESFRDTHRVTHSGKILSTRFWLLVRKTEGKKIGVVVMQENRGKYFFSIVD